MQCEIEAGLCGFVEKSEIRHFLQLPQNLQDSAAGLAERLLVASSSLEKGNPYVLLRRFSQQNFYHSRVPSNSIR